jgi:hypothetical protein
MSKIQKITDSSQPKRVPSKVARAMEAASELSIRFQQRTYFLKTAQQQYLKAKKLEF